VTTYEALKFLHVEYENEIITVKQAYHASVNIEMVSGSMNLCVDKGLNFGPMIGFSINDNSPSSQGALCQAVSSRAGPK
jgi:hypothetical protein